MHRFILLTLAVVLASAAHGGAADEMSADDLLKTLRDKDALFDNVKLEYETRGEHTTTPFPAWKYPALAKQHGWENEKPVTIRVHFRETLTIRGRDVTFTRTDLTKPEDDGSDGPRMTPSQKWSNAQGVNRELSVMGGTGRGHSLMEIEPTRGFPQDMIHEQAMAIEFAHGFGFGKRIRKIDTIAREGSGLRVEGTIQIWWEDQSNFSLLLDDHFIVRQARIEANVHGNRTRFEVATNDVVLAGDFALAATGSFTRTALGREVEGRPAPTPKIAKQFSTELVGIFPDLDDATYKDLLAIPLEPGTQVNDRLAGFTWFVGEEPPDKLDAINATLARLADVGPPWPTPKPQTAATATTVRDPASDPPPSFTLLHLAAAVTGVLVVAIAAWRLGRKPKSE